ncbi:hypothetical protein J6590_041264 [Homalodisca vitripennis]|nr:hypothetical protein J6590_041264 [Homalodisca vitripennis]
MLVVHLAHVRGAPSVQPTSPIASSWTLESSVVFRNPWTKWPLRCCVEVFSRFAPLFDISSGVCAVVSFAMFSPRTFGRTYIFEINVELNHEWEEINFLIWVSPHFLVMLRLGNFTGSRSSCVAIDRQLSPVCRCLTLIM